MNKTTYLITGSSGQLGKEFQKIMKRSNIPFYAPPENECDITNKDQLEKIIKEVKPGCIINCAAYNLVDKAEEYPEEAHKVNSGALEIISEICKENDIFLIHYSSDYVFDGQKLDMYDEKDVPNPLNVYGKSKLKGEKIVQDLLSDFLIFRLSWVYGDGEQNFLSKSLKWASELETLIITADEVSIPTYCEDIVKYTLMCLDKKLCGLFHLTNSGYASRYEVVRCFFDEMNIRKIIIPVSIHQFMTKAKRPLFCPLSNELISKTLGVEIPSWEDGIKRYVRKLDG